ncbi:MAG TPA: hypothetical protein VM662_08360 [Sphingomonas sp.]|nr:hypothetical protein [Sphingomonas sp.]
MLLTLGWTGTRVALLWSQTGSLPAAVEALIPFASADAAPEPAAIPAQAAQWQRRKVPADRKLAVATFAAVPQAREPRPVREVDPLRVQIALLGLVQYGPAIPIEAAGIQSTGAPAPERLDPLPGRWSASAWAAFRPGQGIGAAPGAGQLGGSQAGVRLAYMLAPRQRLAGFARFTAPLSTRGRELSLGLEWQPTRAPVRLVAEQRFALDGGGSGPGLGVVAGVDASLAHGFRLESYGQAGAVRRRRIEPYADGAARATRAVFDEHGVRLALGAGAWGAAQRDAARLDLGPSALLAVPVAGQTFRLALDWRQRVAGRARPGSGPALTIGSDF